MSEETKSYRPSLWRRQVSLTSFLVIVALIGVILAAYVVPAYRRYQREESVRVIKATGGRITKTFDRMLFQGEAVDDAAIDQLVGRLSWFPELRQVDLSETGVTDTGLMMLIRLPNVQTLYVFKSKVTPEGIQKALDSRPELKIVEAKPDPIATGLAMTPVYREAIIALAFSPDGQHVLAGNGDGMLHCLDVTGSEPRRTIAAHEEWLFDLEFSPRGDRIVTAGGDNFIRLWSFPALEPLAEIEAHDDDVHDVAWLADTQLASAGDDMTVRLWSVEESGDVTTLQSAATSAFSHDGNVPRLAQSTDGRVLLSASRDATIGIWSIRDRFEMSKQLAGHNDDVMDISVSPDANEVISVSYDGSLCRWDLVQAKLTQRVSLSRKRLFSVAVDWPRASAIIGGQDGLAKLDLRDCRIVRRVRDQELIARIAKDPSGDLIATASADGRIVLRDKQLDPISEIRLYDRALDPLSDDEFQAASVETSALTSGKSLPARMPLPSKISLGNCSRIWQVDSSDSADVFVSRRDATMAKTTRQGKCELCGAQFSKAAIARHLASCVAKHEPEKPNEEQPVPHEILHLQVEGKHLPQYWIHVEIAAKSHFFALDQYLRNLWLECCEHLSAFHLPKKKQARRLASNRADDWFEIVDEARQRLQNLPPTEEEIMDSKIESLVRIGDVFTYDYDFGSTTKLKLKVLSKRDGVLNPGNVRLLARNLAPEYVCECGNPAVDICTDCFWKQAASPFHCSTCIKKHECGEDCVLPIVNSPRMGVCGYTG